jgi:predicted nucleic acid-binding protein
LFSTITEGEIHGLARCWNWGEGKRKVLSEVLNELVRLDAGLPDVVETYALLYWHDQKGGRSSGENDLWIAACAKAANAVLLTCDRDFLWLSPELVRVEHVSQLS